VKVSQSKPQVTAQEVEIEGFETTAGEVTDRRALLPAVFGQMQPRVTLCV
jgi:hypothetical protein